MDFGEIFSKSWVEYKNNFSAIFFLIFLFIGIPSLIISLISISWFSFDESVRAVLMNPDLIKSSLSPEVWTYLITMPVLGIISLLLTCFVYAGLISISVKASRFSFRELLKFGKHSFFKNLLFTIVIAIFLFGLLLLLIIPGIIFAIYWIFGVYVLFDEDKPILKSLKRSREIVRGKWWRVFGYIILLSLILIGIAIVAGLIATPTELMYKIAIQNGETVSIQFYATHSLLSWFSNLLLNLIIVPIGILFFKNFYFSLKTLRKEVKPRK